MLPTFQAMTKSILAVFGRDAFLRGSVPCRVSIQRGVQTVGSDDNVVTDRIVATIDKALDPKVGDTISGHPEGSFVIDAPLRQNGYSDRWIVREVAP